MEATAIVFAGQGSQCVNMGKDIANSYAECMHYWEQAEEYSSLPLRSIYWERHDETEMLQTQAVQPALTCVALSLFHIYSLNNTCACVAGHSLGEYPALASAGVLSISDVLRITAERGRLMQHADVEQHGGMVAILKLPRTTVEQIVNEVCSETGAILTIANYNTPVQYVLSGEKAVFPLVVEKVSAHKGRGIPLSVSGAFHSPMMQKAEEDLCILLDSVKWNDAQLPFYSNVTATALTTANDIHTAMRKQMTSSVQWVDITKCIYENGVHNFIEIAAKPVLSSLIRTCLGDATFTTRTLSSKEDI